MKSIGFWGLFTFLLIQVSCTENNPSADKIRIIGFGQMPAITKDKAGALHIVYGNKDTILYSMSGDGGKTFSDPVPVGILPNLAASSMRGPQIACSEKGLTVIADNTAGDIFSYLKEENGKWMPAVKVNDVDSIAKEGLMALSGEGQNLFAVWLDLRNNAQNKIAGAKSSDGGKSWSKNIIIYESPDSTVCECCKPSVVMKGDHVYVMFRNWLNGNRDLYLIESPDGGIHFGEAQKLGHDGWKLDGCPMDGGGLVIDKNNTVQTVWRRENQIFACQPGNMEKIIGEGKSCVIESIDNKNVYAWTENGEVVCLLPGSNKKILGNGLLPVIKAIDDKQLICVWEHEKQIQAALINL